MQNDLDWDYTSLADAYVHRPGYAPDAIAAALAAAEIDAGAPVLDLGAGAGHLTLDLAGHGLQVTALEPNARMRAHGVARTRRLSNVTWIDARMEETGLVASSFALTSYGSSFGVVEQSATLREASRLLRPGGSILLVFNHRDLEDPLQAEIEAFIHAEVPAYRYGARREDQAPWIEASGLFERVRPIEARILHPADVGWVRAWSSHATLQRQAGDRFDAIVRGIAALVERRPNATVPYVTRAWVARRAA